MEYYSVIKNDELETCLGKRMYLKIIIISKINQTYKLDKALFLFCE